MKELDTDYLIHHTTIFDGEREYNSDEIFKIPELKTYFNRAIVFSNEVDNMKKAVTNGKSIYITTNKELNTINVSFK